MKAPGKLPDVVGNFFPLPNVIFHLGLSAEEIATYAYLLYCEDRKTFQCFPSYSSIGKAIGKTFDYNRTYNKNREGRRSAQRQSALYDPARR